MNKKYFKPFLMTTMNGMVYGLFATLIIGVIIQQIGKLTGIELLEVTIYGRLASLMGVGIGLGIGLSLKMNGLKLVVASVMGGIASSFTLLLNGELATYSNELARFVNEPVKVYLVTIFGIILLNLILKKKTPFDILLIPLTGVLIATVLTLIIGGPVRYVIDLIQNGIQISMTVAGLPMTIIIAIIMGMLLTSPLSSAAIAIAITLDGAAGGAAVIGCTAQMIGFAVQSRKDNNIGMVLSIAFGTSMLQFKNILLKPIIWLPTIIASAILAPIAYVLFNTETTQFGSGMGSSGFVGQLQTLEAMDYSNQAWISIIYMILGSALLVYAIDLFFRKKKWIINGDLAVNRDIA